jgi:endo-1,4-beta-xylanase
MAHALVADTYSRFLDAVLDEPAVMMVVTSGLSDRYSWLAKSRSDRLSSRPCPFDADLKPQPASEAMAKAVAMHAKEPLVSLSGMAGVWPGE